jgi:hypothetical protein
MKIQAWLVEHWLPLLALIVASYAAVMATINAYFNWRNNRRKLRITLRFGYTMFCVSGKPLSREMIVVDVKNVAGPAQATYCFLETPKAQQRYRTGEDPFEPVELVHGEHASFSFFPGKLAKALQEDGHSGQEKVRAVVRERSGATFKSKLLSVDVDKLAQEYDEEQKKLGEAAQAAFERMDPRMFKTPDLSSALPKLPKKR